MKEWNYENDQWTKLPSHLRHLPLFTRHYDIMSLCIRTLWAGFLKFIFFRFYIRLSVVGDLRAVYKKHPKLLVIANHASHLDAIAIATAIPFRVWINLYFAAAKDYFFSNAFMSFFSKHCIGAIPIDRKDKRGGAVKLCITLLLNLSKIWMVVFPEGTRSQDGLVHPFKKGISVFAERSNTPILFLYLDGPFRLWPKNGGFAKPGTLKVYVGPICEPQPLDAIYNAYRTWLESIHPGAMALNHRSNSSLSASSKDSEELKA